MLTALIASKGMGETVLQLAEKVMRNVAAYRQMAGPLVGWWYGVKAKLTAATTAEEVMAGWCIRRLAGDGIMLWVGKPSPPMIA